MRKKGYTFTLEVKDTQAHSWQGKIKWIEGQKEEYFRSVLELITLLDSAIIVDRKNEMTHLLNEEGAGLPQIFNGESRSL